MVEAIILFIMALFAGAYGVMIGAGGGFIFVPMLLIVFNISPTIAAGTGLMIVLINSLVGIKGYSKQKRIHYKLGILVSIGAIPGTILGMWFNTLSSSQIYNYIFAVLILGLACFLILKRVPSDEVAKSKSEIAATLELDSFTNVHHLKFEYIIIGIILGVVSGFFGIGGGWLLVPILIYYFKFKPHYATATSLFSLCIYTAFGVIPHVYLQHIDWYIVLWGGIGVIVGGKMGVYLSTLISGKWIIRMLSLILIIIGTQLLLTS